MKLDREQKEELKRAVVECLSGDEDVRRIVVFGSFLSSDEPHDMDVAVFQTSREPYLPLALRYRRRVRPVTRRIPVDVFPIRPDPEPGGFLSEIERGEVVYERRDIGLVPLCGREFGSDPDGL